MTVYWDGNYQDGSKAVANEPNDNLLGTFLKDRRTKLDPAALGFSTARRRTPGLRREEVALRANVSATWYTWLEQGRNGTPSADVLDRLAKGLALNPAEREHLFLLAQNRPPEVVPPPSSSVSDALQRVLDAFEHSPAFVRTAEWDVVAGNRAARLLWPDVEVGRHNIVEAFFQDASFTPEDPGWTPTARGVVAQFRSDTARTGFGPRARHLVEAWSAAYPPFQALWADLEVGAPSSETKTFHRGPRGDVTFETSTFGVEGSPGLTMVVLNPATDRDRQWIQARLEGDRLAGPRTGRDGSATIGS